MGDERPRILIVDDHPANRLAFGAVLEEAGYDVWSADSGPEALQIVLREEFAAILLDVRMPCMDGYEVTACLRKLGATKETPILLISAYDRTPAQIAKGFQAGATDYLFNPLDEDILKSKVATLVQFHVRIRKLKEQVSRLTRSLEAIQGEIGSLRPAQAGLQERVGELGFMVHSLQQELERSPSSPKRAVY